MSSTATPAHLATGTVLALNTADGDAIRQSMAARYGTVDPAELTFEQDGLAVEVYGPFDPETHQADYLGLVDLHAGTFYSNRTRRTHVLTDTQLEVEAACRARVAELV